MKNIDYDRICELEKMKVCKRFLPYAVGTPSASLSENDQYKRANFVFFTDSHIDAYNIDESLDNVERTIDFADNFFVPFDAVLYGGDLITPYNIVDKEQAIHRCKPFFDRVKKSETPFIFSKGNHDTNDWDNTLDRAFNDDDWGSMYLDFAEKKYGLVRQKKKRGSMSTWHYYDVKDKKIRIIAVDTMDTDKTIPNEQGRVKYHSCKLRHISQEQFDWITNVALNFNDKEEKDWGVIFVTHQLIEDDEAYGRATEKLIDVCVAMNNAGKYDCEFICKEDPVFNFKVFADFTKYKNEEKRPHTVCWLLGHHHTDMYRNVKGINIINTTNGSCAHQFGDAQIVRAPGTSSQNAFDLISVDTVSRRIRMVRYGAGINCYGEGGDRFLPDGLEY